MEISKYVPLELNEALTRSCDYVEACYELSILLRHFYVDSPKSLQSLMFKDVLTAFHQPYFILSKRSRAAVQCVLNAVENVIPRQKRILAVNEFKRTSLKLHRQQKKLLQNQKMENGDSGSKQLRNGKLPGDILMHIFQFLDVSSLASAMCVCRDWSMVAKNNTFWEKHFHDVFERNSNDSEDDKGIVETRNIICETSLPKTNSHRTHSVNSDFWRYRFYEERERFPNKMRISNRVFCNTCKRFFWLKFASLEIVVLDVDHHQGDVHCKKGRKHFFSFLRSSDIVQFISRQIDNDWIFDTDIESSYDGEHKFWSLPCI